MNFFFYTIVVFLFFLLPILIRVDGAFSPDRRIVFVVIKLYGIRILNIKLYFDKEKGIAISLNGKKGREISEISDKNKNKKTKSTLDWAELFSALQFSDLCVDIRAGGEPMQISLTLGYVLLIIEDFLCGMKQKGRLTGARVRVLPIYDTDSVTVKFSTTIYTAPALIIFALAHTIKGEKYAKRSDRKFDG